MCFDSKYGINQPLRPWILSRDMSERYWRCRRLLVDLSYALRRCYRVTSMIYESCTLSKESQLHLPSSRRTLQLSKEKYPFGKGCISILPICLWLPIFVADRECTHEWRKLGEPWLLIFCTVVSIWRCPLSLSPLLLLEGRRVSYVLCKGSSKSCISTLQSKKVGTSPFELSSTLNLKEGTETRRLLSGFRLQSGSNSIDWRSYNI